MSSGIFGARRYHGGWQVVVKRGGVRVASILTGDPKKVCPFCGHLERNWTMRDGRMRWFCSKCLEEVGWSERLVAECPGCGLVVKEWTDQGDGKIRVVCRACGGIEAYPD